ncbi:hypothetical protein V4Y02_23940, partial [Escherichia coli]
LFYMATFDSSLAALSGWSSGICYENMCDFCLFGVCVCVCVCVCVAGDQNQGLGYAKPSLYN